MFSRPRTRHLMLAFVTISAAILFLGIPLILRRTILTSVNNDIGYDTTVFVAEVVHKFVATDPDHGWPASWDELASISHEGNGYHWPTDRRLLEHYVAIDFTTSYEQILISDFPAQPPITPRRPCQLEWEQAVWLTLKPIDTPSTAARP